MSRCTRWLVIIIVLGLIGARASARSPHTTQERLESLEALAEANQLTIAVEGMRVTRLKETLLILLTDEMLDEEIRRKVRYHLGDDGPDIGRMRKRASDACVRAARIMAEAKERERKARQPEGAGGEEEK